MNRSRHTVFGFSRRQDAEAVWKLFMPLPTQCIACYESDFSVIEPSKGTKVVLRSCIDSVQGAKGSCSCQFHRLQHSLKPQFTQQVLEVVFQHVETHFSTYVGV